MIDAGSCGIVAVLGRAGRVLAAVGVGLTVTACGAQLGPAPDSLAALQQPQAPSQTPSKAPQQQDNRSELHKATEYWGQVYAKNPRDAQTALNYARNLKAMGDKQQALSVLQQASAFNGGHRGIMSEHGRLALELDQVDVAQKLLEQADDPGNPDWKTISARGTLLAKQGRYRDAIPLYERALGLAPGQASVLNNLALAHAMEGNADKAEQLLKQAAEAGGHKARVNQNLALVLGLQGKYDEAKVTGARVMSADSAASNVEYLQRIVQLEPKPMALAQAPQARGAARDAPERPQLKGATADGGEAISGWATNVAGATQNPAR